MAAATVYRWIHQDRVDRGEVAGTSTVESAELRAARRRIAELESELIIVKRASALFDEGRVVRPEALFDVVETLANEGHGTKRVCRLLRVAPSGFFRWRNNPPSNRAIRRAWLAGTSFPECKNAAHSFGQLLTGDSEEFDQRPIAA